jgi:hypothetical protein
MIPILVFAAALTAVFRPAHPTVGDPITIEFQQPVVLDPAPQYEIVSNGGKRVVVRTFTAKPFALSGRSGGIAFRNLVVPVESVLKPKDDLKPAPLAPPREQPYPRLVYWAIGIAAAVAAMVWAAVILLAKRRHLPAVVEPVLPPLERYRATVLRLRDDVRIPKRWAALADATRAYLAATRPGLGAELTTAELLRRRPDSATLAEILHQGDLEKFSPWGPMQSDFASVAERALRELAPEPVVIAEEAA